MMDPKKYASLRKIREKEDLKLPPLKYLSPTIGETNTPLHIRYYQVQMAIHLASMRRFVVGDDTGLGKTVEIITGLCLVWEKNPLPALIMTTKSSAPQWVEEFEKFTRGVNAFLYEGTPKQRATIWEEYSEADNPKVLVMNYRKAWQDFSRFQDLEGYILITDECTAYKTISSQTHQMICHFANHSARMWGATATLIKNHLIEGYAIFRVIVPGLFDNRVTYFKDEFCITEKIHVPQRNIHVSKVVGYRPEMIEKFKEKIDPFYLGRPKHKVASELPVLVKKTVETTLTKFQDNKYVEAGEGSLFIKGEDKEISPLTALIYYQQIVNHPELLDWEGKSPKLETLIELLVGDFGSDNVIIFTRFRSMVDIMVPVLEKALQSASGVKKPHVARVTGSESAAERNRAKNKFQDEKDPVRVICITSAGGEAINLQSAKAIIFYDTPWSAGEYLQILGRMIRIGSAHDRCYAVHIVARRSKGRAWKTIDHHVLEVIEKKLDLVERVLGQRLKGEEEIGFIDASPEVNLIYSAIQGKTPTQGKQEQDEDEIDLSFLED